MEPFEVTIEPTPAFASAVYRSLIWRTHGAYLDWLLDRLEPRAPELSDLRGRGASIDISCYWLSASGHGGPTISPWQAQRLASLDLDCGFDLYFPSRSLNSKPEDL